MNVSSSCLLFSNLIYLYFLNIVELSYDMKRARETKQIESTYYCEINIYVTAAPKSATAGPPSVGNNSYIKLKRAAKTYSDAFSKPFFTAEQLYSK